MATWQDTNPGFAYARYDLAAAHAYLAAQYPPDVSRAFRVARHAAHKADIFRLALLCREGGFYADADDRCIRPLTTLLRPGLSCLLYQEHLGTIANNFIGVVPGHPLIAAALRRVVDATNEGRVEVLWLETGPALVSRCLVDQVVNPARPVVDALAGIDVLFHTALRHVVSFGCSATYKATPRNWQFIGKSQPKVCLPDELRDLLALVPTPRA
jgi:mannosyltransferase OCH1-like enzyme